MSFENGWFEMAERCISPNFNARPAGQKPQLLVIHNISLPPKQYGGGYIERFFQNQLEPTEHPYFEEIAHLEVSAHFLIRRDGSLVQFVSCDARAWHAGVSCYQGRDNCNDFSIGIELEGCDDEPYKDEQYTSLTQLTNAVMAAYPLISPSRVTGHEDIAPGRKTDPGKAFDWPRYKASLV
jgi:AmpD protein